MNQEESDYIDKPLEKSVNEILVERVGKIEKVEIYSSSTEFLIMFPNDYSVHLSQKGMNPKWGSVKVYFGVGDVTSKYFPGRSWRRVDRKIISPFLDRISTEDVK